MSPEPTDGELRRAEIEAWWTLAERLFWVVARILAFFLGFAILAVQAFVPIEMPVEVRVLLIAVAAGLMGSAVAVAVAQVLQALRGGSSDER